MNRLSEFETQVEDSRAPGENEKSQHGGFGSQTRTTHCTRLGFLRGWIRCFSPTRVVAVNVSGLDSCSAHDSSQEHWCISRVLPPQEDGRGASDSSIRLV